MIHGIQQSHQTFQKSFHSDEVSLPDIEKNKLKNAT